MKYQVTFMARTDGQGETTEDPTSYLDIDLEDGIVLDSVFVERATPDALHVQETMDEDDSFLSVTTEVWEFDVADGREREFLDALRASRVAIEVTELNEMMANDTINTAD